MESQEAFPQVQLHGQPFSLRFHDILRQKIFWFKFQRTPVQTYVSARVIGSEENLGHRRHRCASIPRFDGLACRPGRADLDSLESRNRYNELISRSSKNGQIDGRRGRYKAPDYRPLARSGFSSVPALPSDRSTNTFFSIDKYIWSQAPLTTSSYVSGITGREPREAASDRNWSKQIFVAGPRDQGPNDRWRRATTSGSEEFREEIGTHSQDKTTVGGGPVRGEHSEDTWIEEDRRLTHDSYATSNLGGKRRSSTYADVRFPDDVDQFGIPYAPTNTETFDRKIFLPDNSNSKESSPGRRIENKKSDQSDEKITSTNAISGMIWIDTLCLSEWLQTFLRDTLNAVDREARSIDGAGAGFLDSF